MFLKLKPLIGTLIVTLALVIKCGNHTVNPYTKRFQNINLNTEQEISIGLQSAPELIQKHGGLHNDQKLQTIIDDVGKKLLTNNISKKTPYKFEFHLLANETTINAYALPGGQIFLTYGLLVHLKNEDQIAGVLGHEIGHVLGRHSAEKISKCEFWQSIATSTSLYPKTYNLTNEDKKIPLLKNGLEDELESDELAVLFMINAGYNPKEMVNVMQILKQTSHNHNTPEFQSSHPNPENRIEHIKEIIKKNKN